MEGKTLIKSIRLRNFLSYADEGVDIPLEPLNVLIGPNAAGKSNLLEALELLRATPKDFAASIREGDGIIEWLWKGGKALPVAEIETVLEYPAGIMPLRYRISFTASGQRLSIVDEVVENEEPINAYQEDVFFFYRYQRGHPVLNYRTTTEEPAGTSAGRTERILRREELSPEQSVLSQRKDPDQLPEITYVGTEFSKIKLYREWSMGRRTPPRMPQKTDLPEDFLLEDASNLGLVLNDLQQNPVTKRTILDYLKRFYEIADDITTRIYAGTVQLNVHEQGLSQPIPATRLSDGTLRYLSLLAILCHPSPPPLVCIEEPELGLHPDIMSTLAELMIGASRRTQIVVTTHSDALVSALTEVPESVIICERDSSGTHLRRLESEPLKTWLESYSLGDLWRMGQIGGNRW